MEKITLSYTEAKEHIISGDIINFFSSHEQNWFQRLSTMATLYFTGSPIYHTGIAVWMTTDGGVRRLMLVEAVGTGRRILDLDHFRHKVMEVHHAPAHLDVNLIEEFLLKKTGKQGYGFLNLIIIGVREFIGATPKETKSEVCSQLAALSWQHAGFHFDETAISPGKLRSILKSQGVPIAFKII